MKELIIALENQLNLMQDTKVDNTFAQSYKEGFIDATIKAIELAKIANNH